MTNPYASGFGCNTAFEVTGFNYGNGVIAALGYSADRLQLTSLAYTMGSLTPFSLNYYYKQDATNCPGGTPGNNGQIQCIHDNVDNGRSATYTYDPLLRLSTAVTTGSTGHPKWGLSWTYDPYGNRTAQTVTAGQAPGPLTPTDPATNHMMSTSGYTYDANGNLTVEPSNNNYTYDGENRLVSFANGSSSGTYIYDGKNLRVKKVSGSTTTVYVFSGSKVIAEYANGSLSKEYVYSGAQSLATIAGSTTTYHHADHLSVRMTTNASGTRIGQQGHFPFGETWYLKNTTTKWQFTSYERDAESGNDYAMARYHINRVGRFSSPDLLSGSPGDPQSLNRYAYVRNNPINAVDPLGLELCWGSCEEESGGGGSCLSCDGGLNPALGPGEVMVDGVVTDRSEVAELLHMGAAVPCPNGECTTYQNGEFWRFAASTNGNGAYFPVEGPGWEFGSEAEALAAGATWAAAATRDNGIENCGMTYSTSGGQMSFTASVEGQLGSCQPLDASSLVPGNATQDGGYHSHPDDPNYLHERFSGQPGDRHPGDVGWAQAYGYPLSLGTPWGRIIIYQPGNNCQIFVSGTPNGTGTTIPICP